MVADVYNSEPLEPASMYVAPAPDLRSAKGRQDKFVIRADTKIPKEATIRIPDRIPEECVTTYAQKYDVTPLLLLAMVKVDGDLIRSYDGEESARILKMRSLYAPYVNKASAMTSVPAALIDAVITVESSYNQSAVSPKGAIGLMQLMPGTARTLGVNPRNVWENIYGGARYLAILGDQFSWNLNLMIAGYNAGPNAVTKYGGRVPPYDETQNYVPRVMAIYSSVANSSNDPASSPFSTSDWAKQLEVKFNIPKSTFANNVCEALRGMSYAIRTEINRAGGDVWKAVGNYRSDNPKLKQIYVSRVKFVHKQMVLKGSF